MYVSAVMKINAEEWIRKQPNIHTDRGLKTKHCRVPFSDDEC